MHTLHVRNVPHDLYECLRRRASEYGTSISAETIRLLSTALRADRAGVSHLLDEIRLQRPVARRSPPSAAALIRPDRDRR